MTNPLHPFYTSKSARRQFDTENADWLKPVREAFRAFMFAHEGYTNLQQPGPGLEYTGSHVQSLWECWLAATLHARSASSPQDPTNANTGSLIS